MVVEPFQPREMRAVMLHTLGWFNHYIFGEPLPGFDLGIWQSVVVPAPGQLSISLPELLSAVDRVLRLAKKPHIHDVIPRALDVDFMRHLGGFRENRDAVILHFNKPPRNSEKLDILPSPERVQSLYEPAYRIGRRASSRPAAAS